jgi:hypothetical protein
MLYSIPLFSFFFHVVSRPGPESSESIARNAAENHLQSGILADVVASYKAQKLSATPP